MNPAILATFVAIASQAPMPAHHARGDGDHRSWSERCPRSVTASFRALDKALDEMADDIDRVDDKRSRQRLRDDLVNARRKLERARDDACDAASATHVSPPPPPPPPPREPIVLNKAGFDEVMRAVKHESFDDGRQRVIQLAFKGDLCATTDQVKALMATQAFSQGKLDVVRTLASRLVDPERGFAIAEALTFPSDREDLSKILNSAQPLDVCRRGG